MDVRGLRVVVIGGGPAGLFLARLIRLQDPWAVVDLYERDEQSVVSGFGVVLSDRTMAAVREADAETHDLILAAGGAWSDVELRLPDQTVRYPGYGFTAVPRRAVIWQLQQQATAAGVRVHRGRDVRMDDHLDADVVVLADGAASHNRSEWAHRFGTTVEHGRSRYIWFGTTASFDALTHVVAGTEHGPFVGHAHPYGHDATSFVVQTDEDTWRASGMDFAAAILPYGKSDEYARKVLTEVFEEPLQGRELIGNVSRWRTFTVVHNRNWSFGNVVLIGDAAHTAHFSVGSGTKMAMEDAVALANALRDGESVPRALTAYEKARRKAVARTQAWGERSMRWWETFHNRATMPPRRHALHFITRTGSLSYEGLRRRHAERIDEVEADFGVETGNAAGVPLLFGPVWLPNRVVTKLRGSVEDQVAEATAGAVNGSGLVLADWRRSPTSARWAEAVRTTAKFDCVFGVVVTPEQLAGGVARFATAAGARVVEVLLGPDDKEMPDLLDNDVAVCAGLPCPEGDAWSSAGDELVERCRSLRVRGVDGVHLHGMWQRSRNFADRVRTETGMPVIVDGPEGWTRAPQVAGEVDDPATQLHLALVTGRLDLIAAWMVRNPRR